MRASWTGTIGFGLVNIPVRLYRAVEEHRARFRYLHRTCRTPLVTRRYCPVHEEIVPWEEVVRGYEVAPNAYIVLEPEELERAAAEKERRLEIEQFIDQTEIDPLYYDTAYYAEPTPEGRPAYSLLQQAMRQTARVAVAHMTMRGREARASIRPLEDALVVETLFYADEVRPPAQLDLPHGAASPRELRTAIRLIESLAAPFRPEQAADRYYERLMSIIEKKAEARAAEAQERPAGLLGELQASLSAAAESRREQP